MGLSPCLATEPHQESAQATTPGTDTGRGVFFNAITRNVKQSGS